MRKCINCGKEIESGNLCRECFESDYNDFNDYLPEYGDTYGKSDGTVLINAKSMLFEQNEMSACSYMKGSYMRVEVGDIRLDFVTAMKEALQRIEQENLEEIYIYSSDFSAFKITHAWREIERCRVIADYTETLNRLIISLWSRCDYITPEEIVKDDYVVSNIPPEKYFTYEDYLKRMKRK